MSAPRVYPAEVLAIKDADTAVVLADLGFETWRHVTVRLAGINTRELRQPGGREARTRLAELLPPESMVTLISNRYDKYGGRVLGRLIRHDGTDVADLLTSEGWATPWDGKGPKPVPDWPRP